MRTLLRIRRHERAAWSLLLLAALALAGLPSAQAAPGPRLGPAAALPPGAWSWGANNQGQLGTGNGQASFQPVPVLSLANVVAVAAGGDPATRNSDHSLALTADGQVWTWGDNKDNELGNGTGCPAFGSCSSDTPVLVPSITATTGISGAGLAAGGTHDLALVPNGGVMAWGNNSSGQLGNTQSCNGSPCISNVPVPVQFPPQAGQIKITAVAAGTNHSLALGADGTVWAWGSNSAGQLGSTITITGPTQVALSGGATMTGIVHIAAGGNVSLALTGDGRVWAWGDNTYGQLGTITTTNLALKNNPVPLPVIDSGGAPLTDVVAIATGGDHSLALKADGSVWAWGLDTSVQLGQSTSACPLPTGTVSCSMTPVQVPGISGPTALAAGNAFNLALLADGTVQSWGDNTKGQLGIGSNVQSTTVVTVTGLSGVSGIAAGNTHALAIAEGLGVSVVPGNLTFAPQIVNTTSVPQPITITNTGNKAVSISQVTLTQPQFYIGLGTPPFGGNQSLCQTTLPPGGWCVVQLTYTPAAVGTSTGGKLTFNDNAAGSPHVVLLGGQGVPPTAALVPNPNPLDFGDVVEGTTSAPLTVTVTNNGPNPVTILNVGVSNLLNSFHVAGPTTCVNATLQVGQTCAISATYSPPAFLPGKSLPSSLNLTINGWSSPFSIPMQGVSVGPPTATNTPPPSPTASVTVTPTATLSPTATPPPSLTAPPTLTPVRTAKPVIVSSPVVTKHPKPKPHPVSVPLSVHLSPARVVGGGGTLKVAIHSAARAAVDGLLQVTQTKVSYTGTGKKRKKVVKTVVLASVKLSGHTDAKGNLTSLVRIKYNPSRPMPATLKVTARTSKGKSTRTVKTTILPKPRAKPAKAKAVAPKTKKKT
jgi:alpha-tubulin suppressor-like RCC1 family protein